MNRRPIIRTIRTENPTELTDAVKRLKSSRKIGAKYVVFKLKDVLRRFATESDSLRRELATRCGTTPIFFVTFDAEAACFYCWGVTIESVRRIDDSGFIDEIRNHDLASIVDRAASTCIIEAPHGSHFVIPSGKHSQRFLRLPDAVSSLLAHDIIWFWLRAEVIGCGAIMLDTWNIASVALYTLSRMQSKMPLDCFSDHLRQEPERARAVLEKIDALAEPDLPLLCCISISASGRFFDDLELLRQELAIRREFKFVSLFRFQNTPDTVNAMATLPFELEWYDEDKCQLCESPATATIHEIDKRHHYPKIYSTSAVNFPPSLLAPDDIPTTATKFINVYGRYDGVLSVHRDDPNDGQQPRHHAYYIDVLALLEVPEPRATIARSLDALVQNNGTVDLVIIPPHPAARGLAALFNEMHAARVIESHDLRQLSPQEKQAVFAAQHVCVLDDAVITGSRIDGYLMALREEFAEPALQQLRVISWYVAIARPEDEDALDAIRKRLLHHPWQNNFYYEYLIELPEYFGDDDCPWCREFSALQDMVGPLFDEPDWYRDRCELVGPAGRGYGISSDACLRLPGVAPRVVGAGSPIFAEGSSDIQASILIAHGIQRLRANKVAPLGRGILAKHVLHMTSKNPKAPAILANYNESLLRACFLKNVRVDEWAENSGELVAGSVSGFFSNSGSEILLGETLLQLYAVRYRNKLPRSMRKRILATVPDPKDEALRQFGRFFRENR